MKRKIALAVCMIMSVAALTACNVNVNIDADGADETSEAADQIDTIEEEQMVGMANPMVEVSEDRDFADKLGINIDTSYIVEGDIKRFIIGDKLADVRFDIVNVNGETVECVLRATKDDELTKNPYESIAGVYASDFTDEVTTEYPSDEGTVLMTTVYSDDENCSIERWDFDGTHFVFTVFGSASQMQLAALYDQLMLAVGADHMVQIALEPMLCEYEVNDEMNGIFNVNMENVETDENGTTADFTFYGIDLYDAVDINRLEVSDVIKVRLCTGEDLQEITVESIEHKDVEYTEQEEALGAAAAGKYDVVLINGGLDNIDNGGAEFIAYEGGTYRFFGFDDYATYSEQGTIRLKIAEDAEIIDHSDDWESEEEIPSGKKIKVSELMAEASESSFNYDNTEIMVEDGVVKKITRRFTP